MKSSKRGAAAGEGGSSSSSSSHLLTLHKRLKHALSLGASKLSDNKGKKWQCTDVEIQRHVIRSLAAFLDCFPGDASQHRLLKDSLADIVGALVWILQCENGAVAGMAANVVVKLVGINSPMMQLYLTDLINPLSSLICSNNLEVSTSCATGLNIILSNLSVRSEKEVWETVKEAKTSIQTVMRKFSGGIPSTEYLQEVVSLLSVILWRWPPSRYSVLKDTILMKVLESSCIKSNVSTKVAVLKFYSALALCNNVAKKLLDNGETILPMMIDSMSSSEPLPVRIEAFKLAQNLAADEEHCKKMISLCSEPLTKAIIGGMSGCGFGSGKIAHDQMSLLHEACHLALITCWPGKHHDCFWEQGIDKVLIHLLLGNVDRQTLEHSLSLKEQMVIAQEGLDTNFLLPLRPCILEIVGWLALHCVKDFKPSILRNELYVNILITCACLSFVEAICKGFQIYEEDTCRSEFSARAVLLMMHSASTYIASQVRLILSGVLEPNGNEIMKRLLQCLKHSSSSADFSLPNIHKTAIQLVGLTCYSELPQYQNSFIKGDAMKTLLTLIRRCLNNQVPITRRGFAPHFHNVSYERVCCWMTLEEWEGKDAILFYSLWGVAKLVQHSSDINHTKSLVVKTVHDVLDNVSAPGPRWFAVYIHSNFGVYGFPNKHYKGVGKALEEKEDADLQLFFTNGESVYVHGVIIAVRCPSLLPPEKFPHNAKTFKKGDSLEKFHPTLHKEVHLSAQVDQHALLKLLDYAYCGYLEAGEDLIRKIKTLAKYCNLQPLFQLLCRKIPKWGTPFPSLNFTDALGPVGFPFADIILEAKAAEYETFACSFCSLLVPHMHAHKIILRSSRCSYLQALFQSGMQESRSQTIKVPISFEALIKLAHWLYSVELPNPPWGCLWDNMEFNERVRELKPYIELHWLAEFWMLEDVEDACFRIVVSCMDSDRQLSIEVVKLAYSLSVWKLVEVSADYMAPLYHKLRDSGELEQLDEVLVDFVRDASVRLSQAHV